MQFSPEHSCPPLPKCAFIATFHKTYNGAVTVFMGSCPENYGKTSNQNSEIGELADRKTAATLSLGWRSQPEHRIR